MSSSNIKQFASNEGFKLLSNVIGDEIRLLQETRKLLEKRTSLDEQYARNLQDLAATADRVGWPMNTHPISTVRNMIIFIIFLKIMIFFYHERHVEMDFYNGLI